VRLTATAAAAIPGGPRDGQHGLEEPAIETSVVVVGASSRNGIQATSAMRMAKDFDSQSSYGLAEKCRPSGGFLWSQRCRLQPGRATVGKVGVERDLRGRNAMKSLWFLPALLLLMTSCGGGGGEPVPTAEALCDGSEGLRVRIALEGGGPDAYGSYIRINHGYQVLEIDGHCSYWMNAGWGFNVPQFRDRGWRTGTLDAATAAALQSALPLADLSRLADCVGQGVPDAPSRTVRTARSSAGCGGSGPSFDAAWAVVTVTVERLWPRSTPVDGAIRVSAREYSVPPGVHKPYAWPLAALSPFLRANSPAPTVEAHTLVTDPESTRKLRALRETYVSESSLTAGGFPGWDGMVVSDGTITAVTFMRDALPYEDQAGNPPF
jgi:hypothetical protein